MSEKYKFNRPDLDIFQTDYSKVIEKFSENIEPLDYEDTIFAEQANDIKKSFESQIESINSIALSAEQIANASTTQSDLAIKKSKKADIKGLIAIIISIVTLFFEFVSNHEEIISYIKSFFNN